MDIRSIKLMILIILAIIFSSTRVASVVANSPQVSAIFAFGDSLTDPGNNNYLNSIAKANYVPYGIDLDGPTGRFCNGKTAVDYIGN